MSTSQDIDTFNGKKNPLKESINAFLKGEQQQNNGTMDAEAYAKLADQIKDDAEYAETLLATSRDLNVNHKGMLAWINVTIYATKNNLAKCNGYMTNKNERKWKEWSKTLGSNHSSLMAAINVMHQLEITHGPRPKPSWSSMPPTD
ncbi:hypothetical protein FGADI_626 [Fusarium gaditjirri]|uniref:Uncharacterized protein n=1 Tax=Fusarium gaditjirri TaxID=282569 RepID=A0A8H4X4S3_9HYPO|nr:hypothetical protein FGADI_626 [Fusarium gaditjirri]